MIVGILLASSILAASPPADPTVVDSREVLASVNGETITYRELESAIGAIHTGAADPEIRRGGQKPSEVLERLITIRLIVQEGRNIGLDELPDVRKSVDAKRRQTLREMLLRRAVADVVEPDPAEVRRLYRRQVGQIRVSTVRFRSSDLAVAFRDALDGGESFDALTVAWVERGDAAWDGAGDWVPVRELRPNVEQALATLDAGGVTEPVELGEAYGVMQVLQVYEPDDPAARDRAEGEALRLQRLAAISEYTEELKKRYTEIDQELLDSLDYESSADAFDKLGADDRVLATVEGDSPVTVADLTEGLRGGFYHGAKRASDRGDVNLKKPRVLHDLLVKRITVLEAKRLDLEDSPEFRAVIRDHEDGLIFGAFVEKVIDPDVKVDDDAIRAYYDEHRTEFTSPELVRLRSIAFATSNAADAALETLRSGADFEWTRLNAGDRLTAEERPGLVVFRGSSYVVADLSEEIREAIDGAGRGDYRRWQEPDGVTHVLWIVDRIPPQPRPLDEVRWNVAQRLVDQRRNAAVKDWSRRLREASEVEVYVDPAELHEMLQRRMRA